MLPRLHLLSLLLLLPWLSTTAQEMNCTVQINSDQIQGTNKQVFETLKEAISEYVNNRKWSEAQIGNSERLDCTLQFIIKERPSDDRFKGELVVQLRRPVYNASYTTPLLNFKDNSVEFNYQEFESLSPVENSIESNLTAIIDYYINLMLGIDFDSFALEGGTPFFKRAEEIVNMAQTLMEPGWKAFENNRNRYAILNGFFDERTSIFRPMWYQYHRQGLDEMALSVDKGRSKIGASLKTLQEIYSRDGLSPLLTLFGDSKIDELVNIYSKANATEKAEALKLLSQLYPGSYTQLQVLKQ